MMLPKNERLKLGTETSNLALKLAVSLATFALLIILSTITLAQNKTEQKNIALRYLTRLPEAKAYFSSPPEGSAFAGNQNYLLEKILPRTLRDLGLNWEPDPRLANFCRWLNELLQDLNMPDSIAIKEAAAWLGLPEPYPHFLIKSERIDVRLASRLKAQLASLKDLSNYTHYGALADGNPTGSIVIIIAFSQRHVFLSPVPRLLAEPGQLEFKLSVYPGYSEWEVIHKLPDGKTEPAMVEGEKLSIYPAKVKLNLSEPGKHQVEIVANQKKKGPQVLADFPLFVGTGGSTFSGGAINIIDSREPSASKVQKRLYELINEERKKAGLEPLARDLRLEEIARSHCRDMVQNNFVGHVSPTTGGPAERLKAAGIEARYFGENVCQGYHSAEDLHRGLMESPGHRLNIINSRFTHVGIGVEIRDSDNDKAFLVTELFIKEGPPEIEASETEIIQKINDIRKTRGQPLLEESEELKYLAQRAVDHFSQKESFEPVEVQTFLLKAASEGNFKFERVNAVLVIAVEAEAVINKLSQAEINQTAVGLGIRVISSGSKKGQLLAILVF